MSLDAVVTVKVVPCFGIAPTGSVLLTWTDGEIIGSKTLSSGEEQGFVLSPGQKVTLEVME